MRVNPTITWVTREACEDFEFGGLEIAAGTTLHLLTESAGTDPRRFGDAPFDITVKRPRHFGFGAGVHHCIGHYVARTDMSEALPRPAGRLRNPRLDGDTTRFLRPAIPVRSSCRSPSIPPELLRVPARAAAPAPRRAPTRAAQATSAADEPSELLVARRHHIGRSAPGPSGLERVAGSARARSASPPPRPLRRPLLDRLEHRQGGLALAAQRRLERERLAGPSRGRPGSAPRPGPVRAAASPRGALGDRRAEEREQDPAGAVGRAASRRAGSLAPARRAASGRRRCARRRPAACGSAAPAATRASGRAPSAAAAGRSARRWSRARQPTAAATSATSSPSSISRSGAEHRGEPPQRLELLALLARRAPSRARAT